MGKEVLGLTYSTEKKRIIIGESVVCSLHGKVLIYLNIFLIIIELSCYIHINSKSVYKYIFKKEKNLQNFTRYYNNCLFFYKCTIGFDFYNKITL